MTQYNVEAEIDTADDLTDDQIDTLMGELAVVHGVVGRSELGRVQLTFTLDDNVPFTVGREWFLETATQWSVLFLGYLVSGGVIPGPLVSLRVLPTADFDKLNDLEVLPGLFGNDD